MSWALRQESCHLTSSDSRISLPGAAAHSYTFFYLSLSFYLVEGPKVKFFAWSFPTGGFTTPFACEFSVTHSRAPILKLHHKTHATGPLWGPQWPDFHTFHPLSHTSQMSLLPLISPLRLASLIACMVVSTKKMLHIVLARSWSLCPRSDTSTCGLLGAVHVEFPSPLQRGRRNQMDRPYTRT